MANSVAIEVDVSRAVASLQRSLRAVRNPMPAYQRAAQFLEREIDQGFINQRDPYGNKWAPLKDSTLELRRRAGISSASVLTETGEMRNSLNVSVAGLAVVASMADFSGVHQAGNPSNLMFGRAEAPIPMRIIFPVIDGEAILPLGWENEISEYFSALIEDAANVGA